MYLSRLVPCARYRALLDRDQKSCSLSEEQQIISCSVLSRHSLMEDSWENWISHLDTNSDNSFNPCVDIFEENRRNRTETHSDLYPNSLETQDSECERLGHPWPHLSSERNLKSDERRAKQGAKRMRNCSATQDHIMSERKRRQQMAERFIALSAIIPGLKKIDKATVLREAISYVKQLKERIAVLEQQSKKQGTKSIVLVFTKKYRHCSASCEANANNYCESNQVLPVPEAEAIVLELEKEVLIRIHCEKRKGIFPKLLVLLENIHLSIARSSVLPFGNNTLNITIIAQMGDKYSMTVDEMVTNLREDLLKLYI